MITQKAVEVVGWTLIHSLWQGLVIAALLWAALRIIPKSFANTRYLAATFSLVALLLCVSATAIYELGNPNTTASATTTNLHFVSLGGTFQSSGADSAESNLALAMRWLNDHMNLIVIGWAIGLMMFSVRLMTGMIYVQHLRITAVPVAKEFQLRVKELADNLAISKVVAIASSCRIQAPVVVGYVKPIILFPIGMLAGLTTRQVEDIILHELSHIKRHDYLVNLTQSIVEAILFFNPFVWFFSNLIRTEREHCCDDLAVAKTSDPFGYARTLLQLEELRVNDFTSALSIYSDKNQLYQRIQRIMEKSVIKRNEKSKLWPLVVLIAVGLISASWMSFQAQGSGETLQSQLPKPITKADTTKKGKKESKSATYTRKSITTLDQNGEPKGEIIEEFNGDEDLRPLLAPGPFDVLDVPMAGFPPRDFFFDYDSLPTGHFELNNENWDNFMREFTQEFKDRFKDFYTQNEPQLKSMMEELQNRMGEMNGRFSEEWLQRQEEQMHRQMAEMERRFHDLPRHEEALRSQEERMRDMESRMHDRMLRMEEHEANLKEFDKEIKNELMKDGYLKAGEEVETLNWNPDDALRVNGKKIKPEHKEKYDAIRKKYLVRHSHGKPE